jgi:hypothetical protein
MVDFGQGEAVLGEDGVDLPARLEPVFADIDVSHAFGVGRFEQGAIVP